MSAGPLAVSIGLSGSTAEAGSSGETIGRRLLRLGVAGGELLFLAVLDVGDVGSDDALGIAERLERAAVHPQRLVAEALDQPERVRHEQDRLAAALELGELVQALVGEALVADGEHFVDEEHVRIDVNRDGEAEPHVHARTSRS